MTNFEKYYPIIKNIIASDRVAKQDEKLISCEEVPCFSCDFHIVGNACDRIFVQWLCEEYKEPIRLTRKQRSFLEFIETGWIVRYESGKLGWYAENPFWDGFVWVNKPYAPILVIDTQIVDFPFIESENKEPFSVEKMLTLEVEE